jgi:hypothetical protein
MHSLTFSLSGPPHFIDTARDVVSELRTMSTQTKARLELLALIVGLVITLASALKAFIYLPPQVDAHERAIEKLAVEVEAVKARASATDVAIAGIMPQLAAIQQGVVEIKADVRDIRSQR